MGAPTQSGSRLNPAKTVDNRDVRLRLRALFHSMKILFPDILAQQPGPVPAGDPNLQMWNTFIWFGAIMVIMWLFMIRPQQKKQKELLARIAALKTGDRVVTSGGIHGVVSNIKDGPTLVLKVDDSCKLTVDKSSVTIVLTKESAS
jgi:preprotein translocase subunit YajC